jgi:ATP-dependent DNA helicase RecG
MILDFINKFGSASRKEIDELILPNLPEVLDAEKKKNKVNNLISSLRISGKIQNTGSIGRPRWVPIDQERV